MFFILLFIRNTSHFSVKAEVLPGIIRCFCVESIQSLSTAGRSQVEQLSTGHASISLALKGKVIRITLFAFTGSSVAEYIWTITCIYQDTITARWIYLEKGISYNLGNNTVWLHLLWNSFLYYRSYFWEEKVEIVLFSLSVLPLRFKEVTEFPFWPLKAFSDCLEKILLFFCSVTWSLLISEVPVIWKYDCQYIENLLTLVIWGFTLRRIFHKSTHSLIQAVF